MTLMRIEPVERVDDDATIEWFREYRRTRDRGLRNTLVEHYLELARALARRFANRNEPLDDLEQVAMLGVLKAVERFDPERGTPFAAFAVPTVVGELRRHFRDHGWMVRVPRRIQNLHQHMGALVTELAQQLERSPTVGRVRRGGRRRRRKTCSRRLKPQTATGRRRSKDRPRGAIPRNGSASSTTTSTTADDRATPAAAARTAPNATAANRLPAVLSRT